MAVHDCISWGLQIVNAIAVRVTKVGFLLLFALFYFLVKGYQSSRSYAYI